LYRSVLILGIQRRSDFPTGIPPNVKQKSGQLSHGSARSLWDKEVGGGEQPTNPFYNANPFPVSHGGESGFEGPFIPSIKSLNYSPVFFSQKRSFPGVRGTLPPFPPKFGPTPLCKPFVLRGLWEVGSLRLFTISLIGPAS